MEFINDFIMPFIHAFLRLIRAEPEVTFNSKVAYEEGEVDYVDASRLYNNGYSFNNTEAKAKVEGIIKDVEEGVENRTFFFLFILGLNLFWKLTTGAMLMGPFWVILIGWAIWYFNSDERKKAVCEVENIKAVYA